MRTIGLIGGISWLSTSEYYRMLNETVNRELGGNNFAQCIIYSFNYERVLEYTRKEDWDNVARLFSEAAQNLEKAGADCIGLCANTAHLVAPKVQQAISIPILSLVDATVAEIQKQQLKNVLLLGTKFTMLKPFFREKLEAAGIEVLTPSAADMDFIHQTIFDELGRGIFTASTKERYLSVINSFAQQGAQGVIFACTEIPLIIKPEEVNIPSFDTTSIHVAALAKFVMHPSFP